MKKILSFLIASAIAVNFSSCGEEECDHIIGSTPEPGESLTIVGNWYEESENEEIRYNSNGTLYDRYVSPKRSAETEGRWECDYKNNKLTHTYQFSGQTQFADWDLKNLTEFSFVISSETVADHKLEKIVETYNMKVGQTQQIQFTSNYPNYFVKSFTSKNERLASVDVNGLITTTGEKGTTYIKLETNNGNVWVKIVVGDDCLDLWFDYQSLMGADYSTIRNVLGVPSINGEDGYSYGYIYNINEIVQETDLFLNTYTGLVEEIGLVLKSGVPESQVIAYMKSHYYPCPDLGDEYYLTCSEVSKSAAIVWYDKSDCVVRFLQPTYLMFPDYTHTFGFTEEQIIAEFGELYMDVLPLYGIFNTYAESVYFLLDNKTGKVTAYQVTLKEGTKLDMVNKLLVFANYNMYKSENGQYAYRDGETQETSNVMIVYNSNKNTITYFDLKNYGK